MFSSYNQLQNFTDNTRNRYKNGENLPWDYGLVSLRDDAHLIHELKNLTKDHTLEYLHRTYDTDKYNHPIDNIMESDVFESRYKTSDTFAIAGGYVVNLLCKYDHTDIDVFGIGKIDKSEILEIANRYPVTMRSCNTITIYEYTENRVQYILYPAKISSLPSPT